jgi:hypothetical protein
LLRDLRVSLNAGTVHRDNPDCQSAISPDLHIAYKRLLRRDNCNLVVGVVGYADGLPRNTIFSSGDISTLDGMNVTFFLFGHPFTSEW